MSSYNTFTSLLVEGGGDDLPKSAHLKFSDLCRNYNPLITFILIIPWATESDYNVLEYFCDDKWFGNTIQIKIAPSIEEIKHKGPEDFRALLSQASGVFISGGDQNLISQLFIEVAEIKEYLQMSYSRGMPFGGTSAGASIMSATMLTGEGGEGEIHDEEKVNWNFVIADRVGTSVGLGLVTDLVIDQHFSQRSRFNRLLSVMSSTSCTEKYGLGIDEGVAVLITNGVTIEVISAQRDKVAILLERVGESRTEFITRILHPTSIITLNI